MGGEDVNEDEEDGAAEKQAFQEELEALQDAGILPPLAGLLFCPLFLSVFTSHSFFLRIFYFNLHSDSLQNPRNPASSVLASYFINFSCMQIFT